MPIITTNPPSMAPSRDHHTVLPTLERERGSSCPHLKVAAAVVVEMAGDMVAAAAAVCSGNNAMGDKIVVV
jgi:hypothetical protein